MARWTRACFASASETASLPSRACKASVRPERANSPLQYQKQLRLQEARRLLLGDSGSAAEVAFHVGYESPSQFSREYARFFGLPPVSDAKRSGARGS
jgi:AraC-like DNA-binding protein